MISHTILLAHGIEAMDFSVRAVFAKWPNALIEEATSKASWGRYRDIPFAGLHELLCWRDDAAAMACVKDKEPAPGTLVHLLLSDEGRTVVLDDVPTPEQATFVEDLRVALRRSQFAATLAGG